MHDAADDAVCEPCMSWTWQGFYRLRLGRNAVIVAYVECFANGLPPDRHLVYGMLL